MNMAVFRAGKHTDMNGRVKNWTTDDLDRIVSQYNPEHHEAPAVIGHPTQNAPAWGWVQALTREGDTLFAQFKDLDPDFVGMLKTGKFKKRSISLNPDLSLRHIGFLGAVPPAVKGLPDYKFMGGDDAVVIELAENQQKKENKSMEMKEFFEALKFWKDATAIETPAAKVPDTKPADFAEAIKKAADDAAEAVRVEFAEKAKAADAALAAREKALADKEQAAKVAGIAGFCEDQAKAGRVTPAMSKIGMGLVSFMTAISEIPTVVEFSEGTKKKTQTPLEFMQAFISGLPKAIEFGEVSKGDHSGTGDAAAKLDAMIEKKMADDKALSYGAAFSAVQIENPDLVNEYIQ